MRRGLIPILVLSLLVAACANNPPPAPTQPSNQASTNAPPSPAGNTPTAPTTVPMADATIQFQQREYGTAQVDLPIPGTLVKGAATEDPNANVLFDSITLQQTGGVAGKPVTIEVLGDGSVTRDNTKSKISADQVKKLNDRLNSLNFFGLEGIFSDAGTRPDALHYNLTVVKGGDARAIDVDEGLAPAELLGLIQLISGLGV